MKSNLSNLVNVLRNNKEALKETSKDLNCGPKAFCTGTILPCPAGIRCPHFGVHNCSTFKKHRKHACPHHNQHDFRCVQLEGNSSEKDIKKTP
jgi:hypothetical protein